MNNQQPYQQPMVPQAPIRQLKTNRGLVKFIVLSIITLGIYTLVVMYSLSEDLNDIASRYDGKKTMNFLLIAFIFAPLTFGIAAIVWFHKFSARVGNELQRRNIKFSFGAGSYWGWGVLGSLIIVGPFVYYYKLFKSMNLLSESFNMNG